MKRSLIFSLMVVALVAISLVGCTIKAEKKMGQTTGIEKTENGHPGSMENLDCIECHKDLTTEVTKQWEQSAHGFVGVKCQVCHGDEANFQAKPKNETCRGCHSDQFDKNIAKDLSCSTCHIAHNFTIHKVQQYR
ncbi:hypothetical protein DSN97_05240 [Deferribacteraceae bacterium V6Fe1]|nr:hypothetical protein DSN97_05240 [Deferribacteraceae bacterium V6Fe1]